VLQLLKKTHYQPSTGAMYLNLTISISPCVFSLLAIDPMSDHVADKIWLVVATPPKNMKVTWNYDAQLNGKNMIHVPNHQPV